MAYKRKYSAASSNAAKRAKSMQYALRLDRYIRAKKMGTFGKRRANKNNVYAPSNSVARATTNLINMRRAYTNRLNMRKMKLEGFQVSRFTLTTLNATKSMEDLDHAGFVTCPYVNYETNNSQQHTTSYQANYPGAILDLQSLTFCPVWPGSRVAVFERENQGTGTKPHFGLLPSNATMPNQNLKWNTRAVQNVRCLTSTTQMLEDNLKQIYNNINVYKSYVTINLANLHPERAVDVYIYTFKYKDEVYWDEQFNSCYTLGGKADNWWKEVMDTGGSDSTSANRKAIELMIRSRKLPKFMKKIKCKKVTLGPALLITESSVTDYIRQGGQIPAKSSRTLKMKFGSYKFFRTTCTKGTQLMGDDVLITQKFKVPHVMVVPVYNQGTYSESGAAGVAVTEQYLHVDIKKTNIWNEHQN